MEIDNKRTYGVEIEAFGVTKSALARAIMDEGIDCRVEYYNHQTRTWWKIVDDSSIRGEQSFELVSPPLKGEDGLNQIRTVCKVLGRLGAKVNKSCGLHVHHDAGDFKAKHLDRFYHFYKRSEKALDSLVPPSRRKNKNRMCLSLIDRSPSAREIDRYRKVNLNAYERHGTIEIRHHGGTVEADKIINWIKLTQRMMNHARSSRFRVNINIETQLTWGNLLQTLGVKKAIREGVNSAIELANFFDMRREVLA